MGGGNPKQLVLMETLFLFCLYLICDGRYHCWSCVYDGSAVMKWSSMVESVQKEYKES
jgi:hypothetical protein